MAAVEREERWRACGTMPTIAQYLANRQAGDRQLGRSLAVRQLFTRG